jgi:ABC-type sulfate transport system permease subunit
MFCQQCGNQLDQTARFCGNCGARTPFDHVPSGPLPPARSPETSAALASQTLNSHVRVLGILWAIYSGFRIVMALWTLVFSRMLLPTFMNVLSRSMPQGGDPGMANALEPFLRMLSGFYALAAMFAILAGSLGFCAAWALLKHQPNGRTLALVIAFVSLISIPFGTGLGVYTLVVLLPAKAQQTYQQLASAT